MYKWNGINVTCVYGARDHRNRMTNDHVHLFTACRLLYREESIKENEEEIDGTRGTNGKQWCT